MGARDLKNLVPLLSQVRRAGRSAAAAAGCRPAGASGARHRRPATRRGRICSTSCSASSAPGPMQDMPWREAQDAGLLWAPLRKPHENALDEHWLARKTFAEVQHPEHGRSFRYPTSKWLSNKTSWQVGRRAPLLGEDTEAVLGEAARRPSVPAQPRGSRTRASRRCTTSRSRCRASRSSISPGSSPRPAARGFSPRWARKASRSSGRTIPTRGWRRWRRSAAAPRATPRPGRCPG